MLPLNSGTTPVGLARMMVGEPAVAQVRVEVEVDVDLMIIAVVGMVVVAVMSSVTVIVLVPVTSSLQSAVSVAASMRPERVPASCPLQLWLFQNIAVWMVRLVRSERTCHRGQTGCLARKCKPRQQSPGEGGC